MFFYSRDFFDEIKKNRENSSLSMQTQPAANPDQSRQSRRPAKLQVATHFSSAEVAREFGIGLEEIRSRIGEVFEFADLDTINGRGSHARRQALIDAAVAFISDRPEWLHKQSAEKRHLLFPTGPRVSPIRQNRAVKLFLAEVAKLRANTRRDAHQTSKI